MKSTGHRSQNDHFHGHCRSIAKQLELPGRPITMQMVKHRILEMLVEEEAWPVVRLMGGAEPLDWKNADAAMANTAIEFVHSFADQHELWLIEYVDGQPTKCYFGEPG